MHQQLRMRLAQPEQLLLQHRFNLIDKFFHLALLRMTQLLASAEFSVWNKSVGLSASEPAQTTRISARCTRFFAKAGNFVYSCVNTILNRRFSFNFDQLSLFLRHYWERARQPARDGIYHDETDQKHQPRDVPQVLAQLPYGAGRAGRQRRIYACRL